MQTPDSTDGAWAGDGVRSDAREAASAGVPRTGMPRAGVPRTGVPRAGAPRATVDEIQDGLDSIEHAIESSRQDALLTPARSIADCCEMLLDDTAVARPPEFVRDLERIQEAAAELSVLCAQRILPRCECEDDDESELDEEQRELRHDIRNRLNLIINYSEMWIEDASDHFLEAFHKDLTLIRQNARETLKLLEQIVSGQFDPLGEDSDDRSRTVSQRLKHSIARLVHWSAEAPVPTTETGRVLVVDDVTANCDIIRRRLERRGHEVLTAEDGEGALQQAEEHGDDLDVILLDVMLPDVDGVEVLLRLKSNPATRDVPVIMISALDDESVVARCIEHGAEDYLSKPINPTFLHARVNACLEKHRLRRREQQHLEQIQLERQRADDLLHDILPARLVEELKATSQVAPRAYDNVAVLFADVTSFTPYCEQHSPEHVVETLRGLVECWEESAQRYGVQKIKTIGDAFMAACGALEPVENPVLNCVRCGLEMIDATQALPTGWNLRVGIHFGSVIGGKIGRRQYLFDLWGNTVNTAARMESHGVPGRINLSEPAWRQVDGFSTGTRRDPQQVKGIGAVDMFLFDGFSGSLPDTPGGSTVRPTA